MPLQAMNDEGTILLDASPSLIPTEPKSKSYEIRYRYQANNSILSSYHNLEREISIDLPLLLVST